ncbi:MAG: 4Fe-4S binding protein [Bacteroidaceae bacterium]|nr:4Fe-4S binding protein [Bacteroidaceae bacterium]
MLRTIRIILAILVFAAITLLFIDPTGTLHPWLGWLAKIQFLPAALALNFVVVVVLLVLTLVLGRMYCSVICPLGVLQDVIAWIHGKVKKNRYTYSGEKRWLRYGVLIVFILAMVFGIGSVVALLAPYSSYGRMVVNAVNPVMPTVVVAGVTFVVVALLAWLGGRTYCNTVCPVGTVLSFVARFSWLKIRFDTEKCRNCSMCTKNCKASCIDFKTHTVDYSRCVVCGNCIDKCKFGALTYRTPQTARHESADVTDAGRRSFLSSALLAGTALAMAGVKKEVDKGLSLVEGKNAPERTTPLTPPGSLSAQNFFQRCTACQLCVSKCPNGVLRPSTDLTTLMQPTLTFEQGFCDPDCVRCSEVCPTGAIQQIDKKEKLLTQIGHAVWVEKNCLCITDDEDCGECENHCPTGAVQLVPLDPTDEYSVWIPEVDVTRCIGCGDCEYHCPAQPFKAIYVEGHRQHRTLQSS